LCIYSAVETQTDQQTDETMQPWAIASYADNVQQVYVQYMFSKYMLVYVQQGKQWWSHVKILTPKQYE
jgi:hypothetical protein